MRSSNTKTISKSLILASEPHLGSNWRIFFPPNCVKTTQQSYQLCIWPQQQYYVWFLHVYFIFLTRFWVLKVLKEGLPRAVLTLSQSANSSGPRWYKDDFVRWLRSHCLQAASRHRLCAHLFFPRLTDKLPSDKAVALDTNRYQSSRTSLFFMIFAQVETTNVVLWFEMADQRLQGVIFKVHVGLITYGKHVFRFRIQTWLICALITLWRTTGLCLFPSLDKNQTQLIQNT